MRTTSSTRIDPLREFARIAALALAAGGGLALLGYWPTLRQAGSAGCSAMMLGLSVAVLGAWLGSAVPFYFVRRPLEQFSAGLLAGLGVRFGFTLGLALAVRSLEIVPAEPLLLWVGIGQVVILGVDVFGLVRLSHRVAGGGA